MAPNDRPADPPAGEATSVPEAVANDDSGDWSGVSHDFIPISGGLGLGEVTLRVPRGVLGRAEVIVARHGHEPLIVPFVRMPPDEDAPDDRLEHWAARLWAPPEQAEAGAEIGAEHKAETSIRYQIRVFPHTGSSRQNLTLGPFERTTAPEPQLQTPDWAKGTVWYQIFPERFRNGNPDNDPATTLGGEFFHPGWTSDWHEVTGDELERHRAWVWGRLPREGVDPARRGGQFYNVVYNRRYGGDLEGVVEKLDELADLGVTGIYFNPVFHARSLHKYDATDYRHIDPTLAGTPHPDAGAETQDPTTWTWSSADRFLVDVLLPEAHKHGIRVILDGVWNHVGLDFWAFRDVMAHGQDSAYASWFDARFVPQDPAGLAEYRKTYPQLDLKPGGLIAWNAWNRRNGTLPVFSRTRQGRLHPAVEAHIFAVTRRWMDPNGDGDPSDGIDGWRLDVVPDVPKPFWAAWRELVKSVNPDAVLIAEVWFDAKDYFEGRAFDAQMNYPFAMPVVDWLGLRAGNTSSDRLAHRLAAAFTHRPQVDLAQMNLLASHDTERLASMLNNPGGDKPGSGRDYDQQGGPVSNPAYRTTRPPAEVYELVILGVALQATYAGAPSIYYGDEYGMHGADDPDCRKPMPWLDLGAMANPEDAPMPELRRHFRAWLRLRSDAEIGPVLKYGLVRHIDTGNSDVFAFERRLNDQAVIVVLNRGATPFRADTPSGDRSDADPADPVVPARTARWWRLR